MLKPVVSFFIAVCCLPASAGGLSSLEKFVDSTRSGRADFTQVVTSPPKEGQAPRKKTSTGTFEFERPGRFRFVYQKPFEQTIVADGRTLWMYDVDLNQVTSRDQSQVLGSTPAALVASAPDLTAMKRDFDLRDAPAADGIEWVEATPKSRDGQLQSVMVGFKGAQLAVLDILDSFGQRSTLTFTGFEVNPLLEPNAFQFKPPAGADVLRQ